MTTEKKHDLDAFCGNHISQVAEKLVALAAEKGRRVTADFNGFELFAVDGMSAGDVVGAYDAHCKRSHEEYEAKRRAHEATLEGQEELRAARERQRFVNAEVAKGLLPFALTDEPFWKECVEKNTDGYGSCTIRYAARWANYAEAALEKGEHFASAVKRTSHDADLEGITGFMYGCAVGILSKCWCRGEELRRWHNKDTQIGTEGDEANESGDTLNPALLSIG
jgi:hypothetical protein